MTQLFPHSTTQKMINAVLYVLSGWFLRFSLFSKNGMPLKMNYFHSSLDRKKRNWKNYLWMWMRINYRCIFIAGLENGHLAALYVYSMANMWSVCIIITVRRDVLLAERPFLTAFAAWSQNQTRALKSSLVPTFYDSAVRWGHLLVLWEFQGSKGMLYAGLWMEIGNTGLHVLYIHCCFKRSFVGRLTFYFPSFPIVLLHNVLKYRREIKRKRYAILKLDYFLNTKMFFIIMSYNYYHDFNWRCVVFIPFCFISIIFEK